MMAAPKTCKTCAYFIQHYRKDEDRYRPVAWGHCTFPRIKARPVEKAACEHYRERSPEEEQRYSQQT